MEKIEVKNKIIWGLMCFALNLAGGALSYFADFPVNLDFLGSILSALSLNFACTALISVVPQFLTGSTITVKIVHALIYFIAAAFFYFGTKHIKKIKITSLIIFASVIAFINSIIGTAASCIFSVPVSNVWELSLTQMMITNGRGIVFSTFIGLFVSFIFSLQICSNLAFVMIRFADYRLRKISRSVFRRTLVYLVLILVLIFPVLIVESVFIHDDPERIYFDKKITGSENLRIEDSDSSIINLHDCSETIFDKSSGMFSSDANCICETDDGCIWIGSYSGLTKYDGRNFTFLSDYGITNVTAILKDKDGILWIGTNDQGVVKYNPSNEEFEFCKIDSEGSVFSVRSFCQTASGEIYAGTSGKLCKIGADKKIRVIDSDLNYINSLAAFGNKVIGTTRQGELFLVENGKVASVIDPVESGTEYTCVAVKGKTIIAGTFKNCIQKLEVNGTELKCKEEISTLKEFNITSIYIFDDQNFLFTTNGVICQVRDGKLFSRRHFQNFSQIKSMHVDYENNIWFTSSRYGILKLSKNNFLNIGAYYKVANAACMHEDELYVGTDSGLEIIADGKIGIKEIERYLEKSRIRYIYVDSKKNMWFCSYGDKGLVKYSPDKKIELVSTGEYALYNYRCITNVDDETLVVGTKASGILFLNSDGTKKLVTDEDGLSNLQILSLYVDSKKNVYAGTDGGGIYVLKDQKIVKHIGRNEGLTSDVIMKIIPYKDGAFLVTSNSLCYMKNDAVVPLSKFPFYNNFDIILKGTKAYVTTSCGLYEVDAEELRQNNISTYKLYNRSMGLDVDFVPNSLNIPMDDKLVLCTNSGAYTFNLNKKNTFRTAYKFDLSSVIADGNAIKNDGDVYTIPAGTKIILLNPSVKNYSIPDFKFKFYIEGFNDDAPGVFQDEITPLNITNLNYGTYRVWLKILDDYETEVLQEKFFVIKKEAFIWETVWFKFYLIFVVFWIIIDICWSIISYILFLREELRVQDQQRIQEVIETFTGFVDAKDSYTAGHSTRVAGISKVIASKLGYSDDECQNIFYCALLHDSGKIGIPDSILTKPGSLTDEEYDAMKNHTIKGWEILKGVSSIPEAIYAARSHHERYDGSGYPDQLKGKDIPELARIICVADAYDAMNTNRCYRDHLEKDSIIEELRKCSGSQFDPDLVEVLISLIKNGVV